MMQVILIGVIMGFFTKSGPGVLEIEKYLWGLHRHQWGEIHTFFAVILSVFFVIHMVLEWQWIKNKTRQMFRRLWMIPLVLFATAGIFFLSWLILPKGVPVEKPYKMMGRSAGQQAPLREIKEERPQSVAEKRYHDTGEMGINGRVTLGEICRQHQVSVDNLLTLLGLPENTPVNQRLGQLKRIYSFAIQDVRDAVAKLKKK